jgi:nicotinamide-nucleotide amidase
MDIKNILRMARNQNKTIGTVESITGGLLIGALTSVSGASKVIKGSLVTYTNEEKQKFLHIKSERLAKYGAISKEIAHDMAKIGRYQLNVDICIALTGNAGPRAAEGKPIGLYYLAIATPHEVVVERLEEQGTRTQIRKQAINTALNRLEQLLRKDEK